MTSRREACSTDQLSRGRQLVLKALDAALSAGDERELQQLIADNVELRREFEQLQRTEEVARTMMLRRAPDSVWQGYWLSVYSRIERGIGWVLLSVGVLVLVGYGLWQLVGALFRDAGVPAFVTIAVIAVLLGLAVLFLSVLREKLVVRRHDPYQGVDR